MSPLPSGSEYVIEVVTVVPEIRDPVKAGSEKIAALLAGGEGAAKLTVQGRPKESLGTIVGYKLKVTSSDITDKGY